MNTIWNRVSSLLLVATMAVALLACMPQGRRFPPPGGGGGGNGSNGGNQTGLPGPPKNPHASVAVGERYAPSRTITARVNPNVPAKGMIFSDINKAFLALRDSSKSGSDAERYELILAPGTYRLHQSLMWLGEEENERWTEVAIRPESGRVVISGAELYREGDIDRSWSELSDWTRTDAELNRYETEWPYHWGTVDVSQYNEKYRRWIEKTARPEMMIRREMVLINGERLKQKLANEALEPGTFKVVEGKGNSPGTLTIQLSDKLRPGDVIEIPVVENLLILRKLDRVQISNIDFIHANSNHANSGVILSGIQSARIEDCSFSGNNWRGLSINNVPLPVDRSRPDTLELINCRANDNGGIGMGLAFLARLRLENCELAENNWRGYQAGTDGWAVAGSKFFHNHDATVTGLHAHHNFASGLWFDTDCARIRIENSVFEDNIRDGMFIEACQGPVDVVENRIVNNERDGIRSNSTEWLYVRKNRFENNAAGHFALAGLTRTFTDFETDETLTITGKNNRWFNNEFVGEPIWYVENRLKPDGADQYVQMTVFSGNACWPFDKDNPFCQQKLPEGKR